MEDTGDIQLVKAYYVRGASPRGAIRYAIKGPPTAGYQLALVDVIANKRALVLCPLTLESWNIPLDAGEICTAKRHPLESTFWVDWLQRRWRKLFSQDAQRNYSMVAHFLDRLGGEAPDLRDVVKRSPKTKLRSVGKPIVEKNLRLIKPTSRRADVARYFLNSGASVPACMAKLGLTRTSVLSYLYRINHDHGLGYELMAGDAARLLVPDGFEVFEEPGT